MHALVRIFAYIFLHVPARPWFLCGRFMRLESRRIARRQVDIMRVRLRSRCRNIRRHSLSELRKRLARQQRRDVSFRRARFARMILRRS